MGTVRSFAAAVADLVLPQDCAGCGADGPGALCAACRLLLAAPRSHASSPAPPGLPPVWTAGDYDGPVRAVLLAYKERGRSALAPVLGAALAGAVAGLLADALSGDSPATDVVGAGIVRPVPARRLLDAGVVLVPVPSRRAAVRARGRDPVGDLATATARVLSTAGVPAQVVPLLRHERVPRDQAGLDAAARRANLAGALAVRGLPGRAPDPRPLVVLDDIVTTGSTLAEAARAIRHARRPLLGAATVAATGRPGEPAS